MRNLITKQLSNGKSAEALRFVIIGGLATVIDILTFNLTLSFFPYIICAILGFIVSFGFNYYFSGKWTFKKEHTIKNFTGMLGVQLGNLFIIRAGLLAILIELLFINERIAYFIVMVICAIVSFILSRFVFHKFSK